MAASAAFFFSLQSATGQETPFTPTENAWSWRSTDLGLGRSFTRETSDSIWIWLGQTSSALWRNQLEVFDSQGKAYKVMDNFASPESLINLSALADIKVGDTIWFRCTVLEGGGGVNRKPKYSGPNYPGSKYYSDVIQPAKAPPEVAGRRWSVAGRIDSNFVEFGFEDVADSNTNFSFDDLLARMYLPTKRAEEPGVVALPIIWPPASLGGLVNNLLIFPAPGAQVKYTLDGADPSAGTVFNGTPISLAWQGTLFKAIAISLTGAKSPILVGEYNGYAPVAIRIPARGLDRNEVKALLRARGFDAAGRRMVPGAGGGATVKSFDKAKP